MIITELPIEIQEKIIIKVNDNTKLNLVCILWNQICKKNVIKNRRFPCICSLSLFHAIRCTASEHPCICLTDIDSIHYALKCKASEHPCICNNGTLNHPTTCRAINHVCICQKSTHHMFRCRSTHCYF